jgi:hypothetical protein
VINDCAAGSLRLGRPGSRSGVLNHVPLPPRHLPRQPPPRPQNTNTPTPRLLVLSSFVFTHSIHSSSLYLSSSLSHTRRHSQPFPFLPSPLPLVAMTDRILLPAKYAKAFCDHLKTLMQSPGPEGETEQQRKLLFMRTNSVIDVRSDRSIELTRRLWSTVSKSTPPRSQSAGPRKTQTRPSSPSFSPSSSRSSCRPAPMSSRRS